MVLKNLRTAQITFYKIAGYFMKIISPLRGLETPKLEVLLILFVFKNLELEVLILGFHIFHVFNQHAASRIISFLQCNFFI
jgi:hypothetical protein